MNKKIALVSCTKLKQSFECKAQDMYMLSTLFKKITGYIKQHSFYDWYILSAKYGLLTKDTEIAPYDVTLLNMSTVRRREWANQVAIDLKLVLPPHCDVYFFAGEKYRQNLIPQLENEGFPCHVPLQGMQIGEQLQYLSENISL